MSAERYLKAITSVIDDLEKTQGAALHEAARLMADSIEADGLVHVFGSGHSVIPAMDIFPRYGSFVGFHPLMDPRLMWTDVIGGGGARELLWLERQEGYLDNFLRSHVLRATDTLLVFSHGGLNAAGIEAALAARREGLRVIAVTSVANQEAAASTHSSGKKLSDLADVVIDNRIPPEDALVKIDGLNEPVAAGSTIAVVAISMSLVADVAEQLVRRGRALDVFVSPNVEGVPPGHNQHVFEVYTSRIRKHQQT